MHASRRRVTDCEVETEVERATHGYRFRRDDEPVRLARRGALERRARAARPRSAAAGRTPTSSTCAASPCVNLANGMADDPHARRAHRRRRPRGRWSTSRSRSSRPLVPLSLRRGTVTAIRERHDGLVRLEVDGEPCVAYPRADRAGRARRRGRREHAGARARARLGRLRRPSSRTSPAGLSLAAEPGAHVVKLPYTPLQVAAPHAEEQASRETSSTACRSCCCTLHSQLAPVVRGARRAARRLRPASGRRAAACSLSDTVRELRARGLVDATVAVGAVLRRRRRVREPVPSALRVGEGERPRRRCLRHRSRDRRHRITPRPRRARRCRRGQRRASALGGGPVVAARVSEADPRERHRASRTTRARCSTLCLGDVVVAGEAEAEGWEEACAGLPLSHMGRGPDEDPAFFAAAYAAGIAARKLM